ncbi:hypothetical protein [Thalassospira alkalitolerans]|uniref:hypothetical protein n=1 Tax=Thalassospira alkalitolerans TaxID=1293890 RepID=UPI003AA834F9
MSEENVKISGLDWDDELQKLRDRRNKATSEEESLDSSGDVRIRAVSRDEARRKNASLILYFYGIILLCAALIFFTQGIKTNQWKEASENILEMIKIAVMPVITLVIGYYFGKSE